MGPTIQTWCPALQTAIYVNDYDNWVLREIIDIYHFILKG